MAADRTAISAVQDLQKQFDLAFGTQQPSSHLAHPLNDNTVPVLASSLCARLTSGLGELDAALNASTATSAASKAVSGLVDFSNELFQAKQLDQARMSLNFDTHRYKLPRQNLGTALQLFSKSCGFDLFSEGEIVTLGGQVCVLDFHLSSDKSTASKTHFTYGAEGHTDEQMDQMLFALTNAQDLNALWSALRDIKQLDHMAVSQSDIFTNVKDACQQLENVG